jgi:hypothetical protein
MSNEISLFDKGPGNVPAHLQKYADQVADAANLVTGFSSLPKMSIKGKQFRYMKDDQEYAYPLGQALKCVILATDPPQGLAKAWYEASYSDTAEFALPDCFSADGVKPDGTAGKKQARSCAECPKNAYGSGKDQHGVATKGKACADIKNLFIVEAHQLDEPIMVMRVPATSLKALSSYGRQLAKNNAAPQFVVTEIQFANETHPQLTFKADRWLEEAHCEKMVKRIASDELQDSLPSKNIINIQQVDTETGEILGLPPAHIAAAMEENAVPAAPVIPAPPAVEKVKHMTEKATKLNLSYDAFIGQKWTDEQMIQHGYLEIK